MVAKQLPNPRKAAPEKVKALLPHDFQEDQAGQLPEHVKQVSITSVQYSSEIWELHLRLTKDACQVFLFKIET